MILRTRLKALLAHADPELSRGRILALRASRLPRTTFHARRGPLPVLAGFRELVLGHRRAPAPGAAGASPYQVQVLERVLAEQRVERGARVVELGCGAGQLLDALAQRGYRELLGVDHGSYGALDGAPTRSAGGVPIDQRGFEHAALGQASLVYSFDTLEHLADWRGFLRRAALALAPRGVAWISYNPYWGLNGAHSAGTLDIPWGHALLDPEEHRRLVAARTGSTAADLDFIDRHLNRVRLAEVAAFAATLGRPSVVMPRVSAGDRLLWRELLGSAVEPPSPEAFVREVEVFLGPAVGSSAASTARDDSEKLPAQ